MVFSAFLGVGPGGLGWQVLLLGLRDVRGKWPLASNAQE